MRAKVEHPFRPLKSTFGFAKVRYRGLVKNANRAFALLALINTRQMGVASDRTGASNVSKMKGKSPV